MTASKTEDQEVPSKPELMTRARAYSRKNWRELLLLALSLLTFAISAIFVPFAFFRQSEGWITETNRQGDPNRPLTFYEHYEQLGLDMNGFISSGRNFPNVGAARTFIYRPVYPAIASIIPRTANIIETWPNLREGLLGPASLRLTFLSMILVNLVLYPGTVLLFYKWLSLHWSLSVSLIAAAIYALFPLWLVTAVIPGTVSFGFMVIIAAIYMFDRWLLAEEEPTWKQIIVVGVIAGILILGKTEFEGLLAAWAWTVYRRRWRVLGVTFVLAFVPQILWLATLKLAHIEYFNADIDRFGYTKWLFEYLGSGQWYNMYAYGMDIIGSYLSGFASAYSLIVLLAAGWAFFAEEAAVSTLQRYRAALAVFLIMGMAVLIGHHTFAARLARSTFFVVLPLAATGIITLANLLATAWSSKRASVSTSLPVMLTIGFVALGIVLHWSHQSILSSIIRPEMYRWQPDFHAFNGVFERLLHPLTKTGPEY